MSCRSNVLSAATGCHHNAKNVQNRREMEKLYKFVKIVNFTDYAVPCTPDVKARSELGLHCALGLRMRMLNKR